MTFFKSKIRVRKTYCRINIYFIAKIIHRPKLSRYNDVSIAALQLKVNAIKFIYLRKMGIGTQQNVMFAHINETFINVDYMLHLTTYLSIIFRL